MASKPTMAFVPSNGYQNSSSFPNPQNEAETRSQMFELHKQMRDFINNNHINQAVFSSDIGELRIIADSIEYRLYDDEEWKSLPTARHRYLDGEGEIVTDRGYIQFENAEVTDDPQNDRMVITAQRGEPGEGIPEGGTTGQVISKSGNNTIWSNPESLLSSPFIFKGTASNCDDCVDTGIYSCPTTTLNIPIYNNGRLLVFTAGASQYIMQFYASYGTDERLWFRKKATTWSSWIELASLPISRNIGTFLDSKSVDNNTVVNVQTYTFSPGKYFITYGVSYSMNATGRREICIADSPTDIAPSRSRQVTALAVNGVGTTIQGQYFLDTSEAKTLYLNTRQTSGATLTANGFMSIVEVK